MFIGINFLGLILDIKEPLVIFQSIIDDLIEKYLTVNPHSVYHGLFSILT
jgi:hypothetical protein